MKSNKDLTKNQKSTSKNITSIVTKKLRNIIHSTSESKKSTQNILQQKKFYITDSVTRYNKTNNSSIINEVRITEIVESINKIVWLTTTKKMLYINSAFEKILGSPNEEAYKNSNIFIELAHPDDREQITKAFNSDKYLKEGHLDEEFRIIKFDGSVVWLAIKTFLVNIDKGKLKISGIAEDITNRKTETHDLEEQLRQSQKMEAIGQLAGGIAHDFNNLLTAINCNIEIILDDILPNDPIRGNLLEINKASDRAAALTRQLLAFSRRQPLQQKVINLNHVMKNIKKMINRLIGEDIKLNINFKNKINNVLADVGQIEQVLINLIVNARDAMPAGGEIKINTENRLMDDYDCELHPEASSGKFVCLTVEDNGEGIDSTILNKIFDPFFTTKGKFGTGLGLSVVYGIVKQHEGWIKLYSNLNKGTKFYIYLPAVSEKEDEEKKQAVLIRNLKGSGEKILIVEDEQEVLKIAVKALLRNGYNVYNASNAEDAIKIFKKENCDFELLFSDVVLPNKNGIQLVDELHKYNPKLKIVLCSGYTDHKAQWPLIKERGYKFLQKPYLLSELLQVIKEAVNTQSINTMK